MVGVLSHRKTFYLVRIGGQALILLEDTLISRSHISILLEPASATQAFYKMHGLHYLNQQVLLRWKETGSIKSIVSTYLMHRFCPEPMLWKTTITNKMLKPYSLMSQVLKSNGLNLLRKNLEQHNASRGHLQWPQQCSGHSSGPVLWCMQAVRPCHFIDPGFCQPAFVTPCAIL